MKRTVLLTLLVLLSSQIVLSTETLNVIVTLQTRFWQSEISDLLTSNTSCSLTKADFVWRSNPAATSILTDFGIVSIPAKTALYEKLKTCLLSQVRLVRSIEIDRSPYSGISSSHSKSTDCYGRTLNGDSRRKDGIEYVSRRGAVRGPLRGAYDFNQNVDKAGGRSMLQTEGEKRRFIPASVAKGMNSDGYRGQGVNVAIFDSGLNANHPHFKNVIERTNWTSDDSLEDTVGHGSFVAGVVAGTSPSCPGVAHESNLFIFRVFTSGHKSYTSWFLDAFNYALFLDIDIINFSVGGPDYADAPFTDKINELTASGIIVISAVGNDGPLWGSILNPADQADVLSVGGWNNADQVAQFSSRGMTTMEAYTGGMGRIKPDILAPSVAVYSSSSAIPYKCTTLSGTSVATPVVSGAVAVLLSYAFKPYTDINQTEKIQNHIFGGGIEEEVYDRKSLKFVQYKNIASMKQILTSSAKKLKDPEIFEQGAGILDLDSAFQALKVHRPHASLLPSKVSNLPEDCPYMWPWCRTVIYPSSRPLLVNFTIMNSMSKTGRITQIKWVESLTDADAMKDREAFLLNKNNTRGRKLNRNRNWVRVRFNEKGSGTVTSSRLLTPLNSVEKKYNTSVAESGVHVLKGEGVTLKVQFSDLIYPFSGYIAVSITATAQAHNTQGASQNISGVLYVTVKSPGRAVFTPYETPTEGKKSKEDWTDISRAVFLETEGMYVSTAAAAIDLRISPTPPRDKRILWDVYHNMGYPSAFVPRDDLSTSRNSFDSFGDHPYTNYRNMYNWLVDEGYHIELLRGPWTCFNASHYHALLIVDPEEAFSEKEIKKLVTDIKVHNLSLIVFADWHDEIILQREKYVDDNTHSTWYPVVGGSNVPAINNLLDHFQAQLGLQTFDGQFGIGDSNISFLSGNMISEWPVGGAILKSNKGDFTPTALTNLRAQHAEVQAVAGFLEARDDSAFKLPHSSSSSSSSSSFSLSSLSATFSSPTSTSSSSSLLSSTLPPRGRIVVYGDSSCFEISSSTESNEGCKELFNTFLNFTLTGSLLRDLENININENKNIGDLGSTLGTELSQYELLTKNRYFEPLLMNVSQPMNKAEKLAVKTERRGRAWEFSRCAEWIKHCLLEET